MSFRNQKRAHKLQAGDQAHARFDGAVLEGYVEAIRNSSRLTTIQMEDGSVHVVNRTTHIEIVNDRS